MTTDDRAIDDHGGDENEPHRPRPLTQQDLATCITDEMRVLEPAAEAAAQDAIARVQGFKGSRRYDVRVVEAGGGRIALAPSMGGVLTDDIRRLAAFGSPAPEFAQSMIGRLAALAAPPGKAAPDEMQLNAALAVVDGVRPENETEAMLAVQMYGTHETAVQMLVKAKNTQDPQVAQEAGNLAIKLMRTYTAQVEALSKLRRGGEQKVRVEHVHVYPGGQAVVGDVTVNPSSTQCREIPERRTSQPEDTTGFTPLGDRRR